MQVILGGGGAIGSLLAQELTAQAIDFRVVSRHAKPGIEAHHIAADLLHGDQVKQVVEDAEVAYLTAGLVYKTRIWQEQWPVVMHNVLTACAETGTKLVFFDNIYMYDPQHLAHLTESTPMQPVSKKGEVRAQIARQFMESVERGKVTALIARAPDFYGPKPSNGFIEALISDNLMKGKAAMWFINKNLKHTCIYTPDAAKAVALLGNSPDAYNQVWHLPTDPLGPTGTEWVNLFASALQRPPKITTLSRFSVKALGWFIPVLKESYEMLYQFDREYLFDSTKFNRTFNFTPTPYAQGVKQICQQLINR